MKDIFLINDTYISWEYFYWVRNILDSERAACELFYKCKHASNIVDLIRYNIKKNIAHQKTNFMRLNRKKMDKWIKKHFSNIPIKTGYISLIEPYKMGNIKKGILS